MRRPHAAQWSRLPVGSQDPQDAVDVIGHHDEDIERDIAPVLRDTHPTRGHYPPGGG